MADANLDNLSAGGENGVDGEDFDAPAASSLWREIWQLPSAVLSIVMLLSGFVLLLTTRPANEYDQTLEAVAADVELGRFDEGLRRLQALEGYETRMSMAQRGRYRVLRADVFYGKQHTDGGDQTSNLTQVITNYALAEEFGAALNSRQVFRAADSLISLGRIDESLEYFNRLPTSDAQRRQRILRRLVERNLSLPEMNYDETYELLTRLLSEPEVQPEERIWAICRRAELQIEQGFIDFAIEDVLITLQRLSAQGFTDRDVAELFVLLGRGYYEVADYPEALVHLERAQALLAPASELRGDALLLLGRIAQAQGDIQRAMMYYDILSRDFPGATAYLPGLLGRAETLCLDERYEAARENYSELVKRLIVQVRKNGERRDIPRLRVMDSLLLAYDRLIARKQPQVALGFAALAEQLFPDELREPGDSLPDALLVRLADVHWTLAERDLSEAFAIAGIPGGAEADEITRAIEFVRLDPATKLEIQNHYLAAGDYYEQRARALQIDYPDDTATSLWKAGVAFDRGGDQLRAIGALKEFIRLSANHSRQLQGIYLLGRCYQAQDDFDGAIDQFSALIDDEKHRRSQEAYASYVPLAQCYLRRTPNPDPARALNLLLKVVDGDANLTPDAPEYRDALIELGLLYSRAEEYQLPGDPKSYYPAAIERITYAIDRYGSDPALRTRVNHLHYHLAHAKRRSAELVEDELQTEMPDRDRTILANQRVELLTASVYEYTRAIEGYQIIPEARRVKLEIESLKFARFWRADCAFELGDYEEAVRLYGEIADLYSQDPSALVALVQITNSYAALGDLDAARTARNRTRKKLLELPPTSETDALLRLSRDAWERLLSWDPILDGEVASANP